MDSGKPHHLADRVEADLQPTSHIELIYMRRRAYLPRAKAPEVSGGLSTVEGLPPAHTRSTRWKTDEAYEMRRINPLHNKAGELIGYRPMIQQGHGQGSQRFHKSFRAADFEGSIGEALKHAKEWRDSTEAKLGITAGSLRIQSDARPWSGVSLIVSKGAGCRAYWGSNRTADKQTIRVYIGQKSYTEAYHDLITKLAERDGIPLPEDLPLPPPPRTEQYRRMIKAGLSDIPKPPRTRQRRSKTPK